MKWTDLLASATSEGKFRDTLGEPGFLTSPSSGDRRFIEFSASQLASDLNLNILRDVTERRNLEREIQENQRT